MAEMRVAVLQKDRSLVVEKVPVPELLPRTAIVKLQAVFLSPFTANVFSGEYQYRHPDPPAILGGSGVGEVISVADDVFDIKSGDIVFCDPLVGFPSNNTGRYDFILQGWTLLSPEGVHMQNRFRNGSLAEQLVTPAECLTVIRQPQLQPMPSWSTLVYFSIAHGALDTGNVRAGQVVAIAGATGAIGSCAVLLALAAGASKVLVLGRNTAGLDRLAKLDTRVVPVVLKPEQAPLDALKAALGTDEVDVALDHHGHVDTPDITLAMMACLKRGGILVLDGSMTCPLPIDYSYMVRRELQVRGAYMSSRSTPGRLIQLIESGLLKLEEIDITTFPLEEVSEAVQFARKASTLQFAVLEPNK